MRQTSAVLSELVKTLGNIIDEKTTDICTTSRLVGDVTQIYVKVDMLETDLRDCVNELCLQCGQYKEAHNGACDNCRWLKVKEGLRSD